MDSIYVKGKRRGKKKIGRRILLLLVLIGLTIALFKACSYSASYIGGLEVFRIKDVQVSTPPNINAEDISKLSGINKGDGIFKVSIRQARKNVLKHKWAKEVKIKRSIPSTIKIAVTSKEVIALTKKDNSLYYVDSDGEIIDDFIAGYKDDLPIISTSIGSLSKVISILDKLKSLGPISELRMEQDTLVIHPSDLSMKIVISINNIERNIEDVNLVLDDLKKRGETAQVLDATLPGSKVVVRGLRKL
jgi:cell division septal protein FtsQ